MIEFLAGAFDNKVIGMLLHLLIVSNPRRDPLNLWCESSAFRHSTAKSKVAKKREGQRRIVAKICVAIT